MIYKWLAIFVLSAKASNCTALVLASVNTRDITDSSFRHALRSLGSHGSLVSEQPELRERFLFHLVDTELKAQAAMAQKLQESEEFKSRMEQAQRQILANLYIETFISSATNDTALSIYYEQNKELFHRKSVKLSHAFFKDENTAGRFLNEVLKTPDQFDRVYGRYYANKEPGESDPDWIEKGSHVINFEKAIFSTPKGTVAAEVIQTPTGFHVIRVDDIRYHDQEKFDYHKAEIKQFRIRELQEQLSSNLKSKAKIEVNTQALVNFSL